MQCRDADLELLGGRLAGREQALDLVARPVDGPAERPNRGCARRTRTARPRRRPRPGQRAPRATGPGSSTSRSISTWPAIEKREHRADQVRAAALVLLRHLARVASLLVAADRLVLDAVVGGEAGSRSAASAGSAPSSATASSRRRSPATRRRSELEPTTLAAATAGDTVRSSNGSRAELSRSARQRDHRHRLGEAQRPAQQRGRAEPRRGARVGFGPEATSISPSRGARGDRPRGRPVDQQAVAKRHPAEPQRLGVGSEPSAPSRSSGRRLAHPSTRRQRSA